VKDARAAARLSSAIGIRRIYDWECDPPFSMCTMNARIADIFPS
jgi:hypothetical protein